MQEHQCVDDRGLTLPFHLCCAECRRLLSAANTAALIADGTAPDACGPDVVRVAPARGKVRPYRPSVALPDGEGGHKLVDMGYRDRSAMICEDVFDTMTAQAKRRGGCELFTRQQIGAGRDYRDIHEHVQAGGMKCSNVFDDQSGGGGGTTDFMDVYLRDSQRLTAFQQAIGGGVAKDIKRKVPVTEGKRVIGDIQLREVGRKLITTRRLVDLVCIGDTPISGVLAAHGWTRTGKNITTLRQALCAALDRMCAV